MWPFKKKELKKKKHAEIDDGYDDTAVASLIDLSDIADGDGKPSDPGTPANGHYGVTEVDKALGNTTYHPPAPTPTHHDSAPHSSHTYDGGSHHHGSSHTYDSGSHSHDSGGGHSCSAASSCSSGSSCGGGGGGD